MEWLTFFRNHMDSIVMAFFTVSLILTRHDNHRLRNQLDVLTEAHNQVAGYVYELRGLGTLELEHPPKEK